MNAAAVCLLLISGLAIRTLCVPIVSEPFVDIKPVSNSHTEGARIPIDPEEELFFLKPEPILDGQPHHLIVGACNKTEELIHSESIIINNDGTSRIGGDIRVNVSGPVNITCFKVLDNAGNSSGAFPTHVSGGLGHNYIVFGIDAAYGYGLNFLIEIYGYTLPND